MKQDVSRLRSFFLRFLYLFNAVVVGFAAWPQVFRQEQPWDLMHRVVWTIYAAFSCLMLLGVLLPLRMLPLLLMQLMYKTIWMVAVALPLWLQGHLSMISGTMSFFAVIVMLDLAAIPWSFVYQNYIRALFKSTELLPEN
jgi:hypothetical protein